MTLLHVISLIAIVFQICGITVAVGEEHIDLKFIFIRNSLLFSILNEISTISK